MKVRKHESKIFKDDLFSWGAEERRRFSRVSLLVKDPLEGSIPSPTTLTIRCRNYSIRRRNLLNMNSMVNRVKRMIMENKKNKKPIEERQGETIPIVDSTHPLGASLNYIPLRFGHVSPRPSIEFLQASQEVKIKKVYIAHPLRGDIAKNLLSVKAICQSLAKDIEDGEQILPVAPYLATLEYLDDANIFHRNLSMIINKDLIELCDELWVYGFSDGVHEEINHAIDWDIPVVIKKGKDNYETNPGVEL